MAWVSWEDMSQIKSNGGLGFRDFQCLNDAFLAKLSWRLLHNPGCLLARILFGQYCKFEDFLHCPDQATKSHGWRGILLGRDLLVQNMGWSVGDGNLINAWNDPWLSVTSLSRPMGPQPEGSSGLTVADLRCSETNVWNVDKINQIFPFIAEKILSIQPSNLGAPDKLFWIHTNDGVYTTKTDYAASVELRTEQEERQQHHQHQLDWNKGVWKLKTAPKVQLLVSKALGGALPVGEQLLQRQVTIDPLCRRCGNVESINHLLFQCEFAEKVWKEAPFAKRVDRRGLLDLETDWMRLIEEPCLPPVGIVDGQLAPWDIWSIWTAHNNMLFNSKLCFRDDKATRPRKSASPSPPEDLQMYHLFVLWYKLTHHGMKRPRMQGWVGSLRNQGNFFGFKDQPTA